MRILALLLFLSSGACALIYEITWTRMLTLTFGSTTFAVSTILASFMAGFGLGSFIFGRYIDRRGEPLKVYGTLEIIIGLFALLFPFIISALTDLNVYIHRDLWPEASHYQLSTVKFVLYFTTILIPASLMGATFPIIVKFFVRGLQGLGTGVGTIYTINTFGAVIGCLATGFILIRLFGQTTTTYWAACLNIAIGITAIVINSRLSKSADPAEKLASQERAAKQLAAASGDASPALSRRIASIVLFAFFVSGFCALAYEVLWTRMLVFAAGVTTYAFSAMLATFLCGLAIGSILFAKIIDRQRHLLVLFAVIQFAIGLTAYFGSELVLSHPDFFLAIQTGQSLEFANTWAEFARRLFASTAALMLVPTILMGATFPLVNKIYVKSLGELGSDVGKAYLLNSIGSALGAMAVGFLIIPAIGISQGTLLIALINVCLGGLVLVLAGTSTRTADATGSRVSRYGFISLGLCTVMVAALVAQFYSNPTPALERGIREALSDRFEVLDYYEGTNGTTTVVENRRDGSRDLLIEGFSAAGTSTTYNYMRMLGHLPMLLCEEPKDVLVIAFGTGTTSGTVGMYEHERFDIVELAREVTRMDKYFFDRNRHIRDDPRTNLIIDDGRNHVLTTNRIYDVISLEPMPPYFPGAMSLYTQDFYEICKTRLSENGVMCQWLPPHSQSGPDQRGLLKAFAEAFPHTSLWYCEGTLAVIGTQKELSISLPKLKQRLQLPLVQESLRETNLTDPLLFVSHYLMGSESIAKYVADVEAVTDDNPFVEFFSIPKQPAIFYHCVNTLDAVNRMDDPFPLLRDIPPQEIESVRKQLHQRVVHVRNVVSNNIRMSAKKGNFVEALQQSLLPLKP